MRRGPRLGREPKCKAQGKSKGKPPSQGYAWCFGEPSREPVGLEPNEQVAQRNGQGPDHKGMVRTSEFIPVVMGRH